MDARARWTDDPPPASIEFGCDYRDCFHVPTGAAVATPRAWATAALAGAEGLFGRVVWGGLLGFELDTRATVDTLAGWRVLVDDDREFVLGTDGSRMAAVMTFAPAAGRFFWTTSVRYHDRRGGAIWSVASRVHRVVAPRCLELARQALLRRTRATDTRVDVGDGRLR